MSESDGEQNDECRCGGGGGSYTTMTVCAYQVEADARQTHLQTGWHTDYGKKRNERQGRQPYFRAGSSKKQGTGRNPLASERPKRNKSWRVDEMVGWGGLEDTRGERREPPDGLVPELSSALGWQIRPPGDPMLAAAQVPGSWAWAIGMDVRLMGVDWIQAD